MKGTSMASSCVAFALYRSNRVQFTAPGGAREEGVTPLNVGI
jgi:hypothetical protein